ncbi:MAG: M56 family metallopeptidase, partial [Chloroflexota bacterium]
MTAIQQFAFQSIVHSLVAVVVLETLVQAWRLRQPALRHRFHVLALALPAVTVPLYQWLYPARASQAFRQQQALLDLEGWRSLEVGGWQPVAIGLGLVMGATTFLFLAQEVLPALRLYWWHRGWRPRSPTGEEATRIEAALGHLPASHTLPAIIIADQELPLAYARGLALPCLVLSPPLLRILDDRELAAVLAHELAHLRRRDNWSGWALLALRSVQFFNPVALLVFRHILYDTERVCDDEAAAATGDALALASGLLKVWRPASPAASRPARRVWLGA